jgi:hypothetical protein
MVILRQSGDASLQRWNECKAEQRERCHEQNDQHGGVPRVPLTCEITARQLGRV